MLGMAVLPLQAQELIEVPEVQIPEEARFDGPMPELPAWAHGMTGEERTQWEENFRRFDGLTAIAQAGEESLGKTMDEASAATAIVEEFGKANGYNVDDLKPLATDDGKPLPLEVKDTDTVATYEGGVYMDLAEKNMAVLIKNVKVRGPEFKLDCKTQLQLYFKKAPEDPAKAKDDEKAKKDNPFNGVNVNFDGIDKAVAFGDVYLEYKDKKDGKWYQAHGERVTYDGNTGEVILSGGYPYIRSKDGQLAFRTDRPDDTIRYLDGKVTHVGQGALKGKDIDTLSTRKPKK